MNPVCEEIKRKLVARLNEHEARDARGEYQAGLVSRAYIEAVCRARPGLRWTGHKLTAGLPEPCVRQ